MLFIKRFCLETHGVYNCSLAPVVLGICFSPCYQLLADIPSPKTPVNPQELQLELITKYGENETTDQAAVFVYRLRRLSFVSHYPELHIESPEPVTYLIDCCTVRVLDKFEFHNILRFGPNLITSISPALCYPVNEAAANLTKYNNQTSVDSGRSPTACPSDIRISPSSLCMFSASKIRNHAILLQVFSHEKSITPVSSHLIHQFIYLVIWE